MEFSGKLAQFMREWHERWGPYAPHGSLQVAMDRVESAWAAYTERLHGNYPFFHPRYAGQMLKPPHPAALLGYWAAQAINPNNHALDGGPPTSEMEKEVVQKLADMFGWGRPALGHLTGGGTIANLEALWVAREIHPECAVAYSDQAHYTHGRMCRVLRMEGVPIETDFDGRMDLDALERALRKHRIGTIVVTPGTTGLGVVDPIDEIVAIAQRHGVRVHADAAYGGFFTLLAQGDDPMLDPAPFRALASVDSLVVDPHKHGLQPYGCGCVLFRDPRVGKVYDHDSAYTYFTSDELHLGEISLECSRPGAAAGALWFTMQLFELEPDRGLGPVLAAGVNAARDWATRIRESDRLELYQWPELDIVTFFPSKVSRRSDLDAASARLMRSLMEAPDPCYLSLLTLDDRALQHALPEMEPDRENARILRSVLMKPEHEHAIEWLHDRVSAAL